ncbi:MAG: hypothetical protein IPM25_03420 [Chloracidobacterium sp.]|nr:hypothetical protein [Chloracidobacterium sp.]
MNENIEFLQAFLKNLGKVGAIKPNSPELALKMIEGASPDWDNTVLELVSAPARSRNFFKPCCPIRDRISARSIATWSGR